MTYARDERNALCDLLTQLGPDQPTLCAGWRTGDLAAHLVLREHRPDAGPGAMGGPLAAYTQRAQAKLAGRTSYADLVSQVRAGPPKASMFGLPGMDARLNLTEYFVHHEDVRRAQPGWQARPLEPGLAAALWRQLRLARFLLRKAPAGVELVRTGPGPGPVRITARKRAPVVTVSGEPAELTLWAMGRGSAALVTMDGAAGAVAALRAWRG